MAERDTLKLFGDDLEFAGRVVAQLLPNIPAWLRSELEKRLSDRGYERGYEDGLCAGEACAFEGDDGR